LNLRLTGGAVSSKRQVEELKPEAAQQVTEGGYGNDLSPVNYGKRHFERPAVPGKPGAIPAAAAARPPGVFFGKTARLEVESI
jgi:hypothetical protein